MEKNEGLSGPDCLNLVRKSRHADAIKTSLLVLLLGLGVLVANVGNAQSHSSSTTHEFNPGGAGGATFGTWDTFKDSIGMDHLFGGSATWLAVRFGGAGGTIDDGEDDNFTNTLALA